MLWTIEQGDGIGTLGLMYVPCVGAIIHDDEGRIVVVRRRHAPSAGCWSIPGGRVEEGESLEEAVRREVREETGLDVLVTDVVGVVDIPAGDGDIYFVTDFACTPIDERQPLVAGDDATDAQWVSRFEFTELGCSPGLGEALDSWRVWPG